MDKDDNGVTVVRMECLIVERAGFLCGLAGVHGATAPKRMVLAMPTEHGKVTELRDAFHELTAAIAGQLAANTAGAPVVLHSVEADTAPPVSPAAPRVGALQVAVGQEGETLKAYVVEIDGIKGAMGQTPPIVQIPVAFADSPGVKEAFFTLVERIGAALADVTNEPAGPLH